MSTNDGPTTDLPSRHRDRRGTTSRGARALSAPAVAVSRIRVERSERPVGVDVSPRISWWVDSARNGTVVHEVDVRVQAPGGRTVWRHVGDAPDVPEVECPLGALEPDTSYSVTVGVRTDQGDATASSGFHTGLTDGDWGGARWMRAPAAAGTASPVFVADVEFGDAPDSARLFLAAGGFAHVTINGRAVADEVLLPGITAYDHRVQYVAWEVGALLAPGTNRVRIELGRGFHSVAERSIWEWERSPWTAERCVLLRLVADGPRGRSELVSGPRFRTFPGPTRYDDIYGGETFDARRENGDTSEPALAAEVTTGPSGRLVHRRQQPIRVIDDLDMRILHRDGDRVVFDVGRVIAGWVRIAVAGPAGHRLDIRYGERLADGRPDVADRLGYYNGRFQHDVLILSGDGVDEWEPRFVWKGFRYVEVSGWPDAAPLEATSVRARLVHNDVERTGSFSCSDATLTRLHELAVATIVNNLHSIPTDTPTYEKNGWTADGMLGTEMFLLNLDTHELLAKWVDDIADARDAHGVPRVIAPHGGWSHDWSPAPPWHAAYPLIPWWLHRTGGDRRVLADHVDGILAYLDAEVARAANGLSTTTLGDWMNPETSPDGGNPPEDPRVAATAYVFLMARTARDICRILDRPHDAERMARHADSTRTAFRAAFVDAGTGLVRGDGDRGFRQSHHVLAVAFGLLPRELERPAVDLLARDVTQRGAHLNTGALSTKYLLPVLTHHGHAGLALELALQRTYPSWGYWLEQGATTLWEHWHEDSRSVNHYFLGTFDEWLYSSVLGIEAADVAYRRVRIHPRYLRDLTSARGQVTTPFGVVAVDWRRTGDAVRLALRIPPGVTAELVIDGGETSRTSVAGTPLGLIENVRTADDGDGMRAYLPAGDYDIDADLGDDARATLRGEG